jgi:hypothetical protein
VLPDYLVMNGYEIVNSLRAAAYGADPDECGAIGNACFDCPELGLWLNGGDPYQGVVQDPAPWYDPASPESARVYGVVGLEVTGLANGAYADPGNNTDSPSGAVRDIMFRVLVEVADECAATYVAGWLRESIEWTGCGDGCMGASVCMLACCPEVDPETGEPLEQPIRELFDLTAVEGPEEVERAYADNRIYLIYEFTLRTGNVDVYKPSPLEHVLSANPANGTPVTLDLPAVYENCEDTASCLTDPQNPAPAPPTRPTAPLDPRYPTTPFPARRLTDDIPSEWVSRTLPTVAVITASSGGVTPLRNLLVRLFHNPFGIRCSRLEGRNPCRACTDILVPYIPPNGTLVIDGRTRTKTITCRTDGISTRAEAVAFGPLGQMFYYPELTCGGSFCVQVYAADPVPPEAMVTIELYQRAGAA